MSNAKHTPTPWFVGGPYPGVSICYVLHHGNSCPENAEEPIWEPIAILHKSKQGNPSPETLANAEHIVKCVNAHDDLVSVCEAMLYELNNIRIETENDDDDGFDLIGRATSAIRKARDGIKLYES